jgi:hypothetical protein
MGWVAAIVGADTERREHITPASASDHEVVAPSRRVDWSQKLSVKFALVPGPTPEGVPEPETMNQQVNCGASRSIRRRR